MAGGPDTTAAAEARLSRLLNLILEAAVETLGYDAASITARNSGAVATVASTDQRVVELDEAQYVSGEGPCLDALERDTALVVNDAASTGDTWAGFAEAADGLGIRSTLSVGLPVDSRQMAASLNLYARRHLEASAEQVHLAERFAEQLAAAIGSMNAFRSVAQLADEMAEAMRSRAVIEQAKGMLMADRRITDEEAFHVLVERSQRSNLKLREVAAALVREHAGGSGETG
jgi:GAF domain-containing protein